MTTPSLVARVVGTCVECGTTFTYRPRGGDQVTCSAGVASSDAGS